MSTGTAPCTPLGFTQAAAAQTSWTQTRARSLSSFSAGIAGKSMPRVLLMPPLSKHASEVPTRSRGQLVTPKDVNDPSIQMAGIDMRTRESTTPCGRSSPESLNGLPPMVDHVPQSQAQPKKEEGLVTALDALCSAKTIEEYVLLATSGWSQAGGRPSKLPERSETALSQELAARPDLQSELRALFDVAANAGAPEPAPGADAERQQFPSSVVVRDVKYMVVRREWNSVCLVSPLASACMRVRVAWWCRAMT